LDGVLVASEHVFPDIHVGEGVEDAVVRIVVSVDSEHFLGDFQRNTGAISGSGHGEIVIPKRVVVKDYHCIKRTCRGG